MTQYNAAAWLLDRQLADGRGDRIAYRIDGQTVSYAELQRDWEAHLKSVLGAGL